MNYRLYHGDVKEQAKHLADNTYDAIFCDPPYGLSNVGSKGLRDRLLGVLHKIVLPDLGKADTQLFEQIELRSIPLDGSDLCRSEILPIVESWIGVPEGAIYLHGDIQIGDKEIATGSVSAGSGVANTVLVNGVDREGDKFLGDYVLYLRNPREFAGSNSSSSFFSEFFDGGFSVPIIPLLDPGDPCLLSRLCAVVLSDESVGLRYNSLGQASRSPGVLASRRTVNSPMLRFNMAGGSIELVGAYRANKSLPIEQTAFPKLIRASAATGGLPPMFKPVRVSLVGMGADRADSVYFHLWLPEKWIDILGTIVPSGGFMGKKWDALVPGVEIWEEMYRVAKPGAYLFAFGGTRTWHRLAVNIEDAGWQMFDTISWLYSSGFPKGHDFEKAIERKIVDAIKEQGYEFEGWIE